jgi:transcriptional regulator with XRE-family HTH domain
MAELTEKVGDRIARLRRSLGWNQAELADRAGCKPSQISKYERNTYEPGLAMLSRIAAVLRTSSDYLITGREAAPAEPDQLIALWPALQQSDEVLARCLPGQPLSSSGILHPGALRGFAMLIAKRKPACPTCWPARRACHCSMVMRPSPSTCLWWHFSSSFVL